MSRYLKLLQPLSCEWVLPTGLKCGLSFTDMHSFTSHVKTHIALWEKEGEDEEVVCCSWIGCDFSCSDSHEYVCHVLFHPYHSYQKLLGSELQNKKGLPSCQLDGDMQNVVPQLEVELRCQWEESKCGRRFESVGEFYTHIHNHAMSERSMCCRWKDCSFRGRDKSKVLEHARTHTHEKVVACPTCGSLFASNTKLKDHLTRQVEPTDASLTCSFCHKCYPNERHLREHVRRHINTLQCPNCELTCNSPSQLLRHIRFRHMESKPHECPLCHKKFKTPYTLSEHLESHRQNTYPCTVTGCKYHAKTQKSWQLHMKKAHLPDQMLYCCHVCELRFSEGKKLTMHLKATHGFELPPGHCRFRYVVGEDGLKRLQTVRLDDESILTPEVSNFCGSTTEEELEGIPEEESEQS